MLRLPYQAEPLTGPTAPSLPAGTVVRWRPLVPITIVGPATRPARFLRAVVDTGADDTIFPLDTVQLIGAVLRPDSGHRLRWRGQLHALRFGDVELVLDDGAEVWRWPATVAFSPAPIRYPILGVAGCLQFMDTRFRGADLIIELETNHTFPGS